MNRHVGHMVSKEQGGLRVEERVGNVGRQRLLHGRARCDAAARVRGELHLALLLRSAGAAAALSPVWPKSPTYGTDCARTASSLAEPKVWLQMASCTPGRPEILHFSCRPHTLAPTAPPAPPRLSAGQDIIAHERTRASDAIARFFGRVWTSSAHISPSAVDQREARKSQLIGSKSDGCGRGWTPHMRGVQPCTLGHAWRPSRRAGGLEVDIQHHLVHRRVCECEIAEGFAGFTRACEQLSTSGKKYSIARDELNAAIGLDLRVRPRRERTLCKTRDLRNL